MKKVLSFVLMLAVLASFLALATSCGDSNDSTEAPTEAPTETPTEAPTETPTEAPTEAPTAKRIEEIYSAAEKTFSSFTPAVSADILKKVGDCYSVSLNVKGTEALDLILSDSGISFDNFGAKLYFDGEKAASSLNASFAVEETPFDIALKSYIDAEKLIIDAPFLFNTSVYGLKYSNIYDKLSTSFLARALGLDAETVEELKSFVLLSSSDSVLSYEYLTGIVEAYAKYAGVFIKAAEETIVFTENDGVYSYRITNDDVKNIVKAVYTEAKGDEDLKALLYAAAEASGDEAAKEEIAAFFANEAAFDSLLDENINFKDEISGTITVSEGVITSLTFTFGEETYKLGIDEGEIYVSVGTETGFVKMFSYKYADTDEKITCGISVATSEKGELSEVFSFTYVKATGDYTILLATQEGTFSVAGKFTVADDKITLTVTSLGMKGVTLALDISLVLDFNDTMPEFPTEYTDIIEADEAELADFIEGMQMIASLIGLGSDVQPEF